jgi:RHS repeat-associated protein
VVACVAAAFIWIASVSLVQAQSCTVYNASSQNSGSPWESSSQEAVNVLVQKCNSGPQGWRACFAATEGWCNALPGYTCIAQMPTSIPTPPLYHSASIQMTVVMTSPTQGEVTVQVPVGIGTDGVDCNNYFVMAPSVPPTTADKGCKCAKVKNGPDPIDAFTGNEFLDETDLKAVGWQDRLAFRRYYNSVDTSSTDMGSGWRHSFSRYLQIETIPLNSGTASSLYSTKSTACTSGWAQIKNSVPGFQTASASYSNGACTVSNGTASMGLPIESTLNAQGSVTEVLAHRDDGHIITFTSNSQTYQTDPGSGYQLIQDSGPYGNFYLIDEQDNVETYNSAGKLLSVADRHGNTETFAYNGPGGLLSSISDEFGHSLTLAYDSQSRLQSIAAPDGSSVQYAYNSAGELSQVTNPDGTTRQFLYADSSWPTGLTGVVDENGNTEFTLSYDSQGRVVSSTLGGVSSSMSFTYNSDGTTTETDPLGAVRTFASLQIGVHDFSTSVSGAPCYPCGYVAATTYDAGGFPAGKTDFNGNLTTYSFDDTRGLETLRTEASGTSVARTVTTQWNPTYRLPTLVSVYSGGSASGTPLRTTAFGYDGTGNLLTKTITDPATSASRTWTYTYDSYGRVLTAQDPRGNVTTYTYYTCTTGSQCGELDTVTDALGHVTTYDTYDADGRPLTITDPNGTVITLAYDSRGHLASRSVGGETTTFSYHRNGLLKQVTLPDGSSLTYTYDAAHRLTQVNDGLGNKIVYTLDAMGNRTAVNTYDPSGALHRAHTRVINTLNEVYQEINAAGTSAVTTAYGYDSDGNVTSIQAPLSRNTSESYDALNRLSSVTDPGSGVTNFSYDAENDLTSVTDPRNLTTTYSYDGFGDVTSLASPDTGTSSYTYDPAGNLATATDARGAVATYGYDALNRVTSIAYSLDGTTDQTLSFTYDQGTDGVGHLTGASDANHSMSWTYDALGEMTGMSQTVAGVNRTIGYGYTSGDLTSMTTPSGQTVTYGYNSDHQVTSIAVNGTAVLSNAVYEPFGPADGWTWGNGSTFSRSFNGDGDITGITSPANQETVSYDDASRISGISNTAAGSASWTYGYDPLDRLTGATSSAASEGWTYDADGNRLSETGTSPSTYSISSTSNEITGITGTLNRSYTYDAAGNMATDSADTDTYNDAGRLKTVTNTSGTTNFTYNALGQMIEASGPSGTTIYVYDQTGHLEGEYDGSGNLIQETVWLGDIPVATIRPSGSSIAIYYVVTDQLDTPREVIRPSDNTQMWTWFTGPFGVETPNENPQGIGTFVYDLRFPGQIAGTWGSTFQNDFRDLDPTVGRYIESDPAGLYGGSYSTYAYVGDNPVSNIDPLGLWSLTIQGYLGFGGAVVIGQDPVTGQWFYGGRLGLGVEAGVNFDPEGRRPGAESTSSCGANTTVGTFGGISLGAGPLKWELERFAGGIDLQSGQTYSEGPTIGSPNVTFGSGEGFDIGTAIGVEVIGHN